MKYTLEQIKNAYWKQFHMAGEIFFTYSDAESASEQMEISWNEFVEYLNETHGGTVAAKRKQEWTTDSGWS
jgi:hypothetical protein